MSTANFTPIPAKPTFKSYQSNMYASDYISNKKLKAQFCNTNNCYYNQQSQISNTNNYGINNSSDLISFNKVFLYNNKNFKAYDRSNLSVNLYTKLNLKDVNVVQQNYPVKTPTDINPSINFNENYTIDETGVLFGNTQCGVNNYVKFQEINL